jgi:hypothetical protein
VVELGEITLTWIKAAREGKAMVARQEAIVRQLDSGEAPELALIARELLIAVRAGRRTS